MNHEWHQPYNVDPACRRIDIFGADGLNNRNGEDGTERHLFYADCSAMLLYDKYRLKLLSTERETGASLESCAVST